MKWAPEMLLAVVLIPGLAWAQLDRGSFTGTVTDSTNAVIPQVTVTVHNPNTGAKYQTTTTASGQYTIPNLPVGTYDLTFEAQGFSASVQRGVSLSAAEIRRIDATLQVGAVTQSVEVTAESSRLQTDSPDVSTTLVKDNFVDLPLTIASGGRVLETLIYQLVPGAVGGTWTSSIVGSPMMSNESLLDGATVTTSNQGYWAEGAVSPEAVQEFKVLTTAVSAEFGRTHGAVLNYIMKSGTNQIHGSGYGMLRNEALNANTFSNNFAGKKRALDRRWDYAFSFGGPVTIPALYSGKNKTFFYTAIERYIEKNLTLGAPSVSLPVPEFYEGDFSRLLGPATNFTDALGNRVIRGAIYDPKSFYQLPTGRWMGQMFPENKIPQSRFSQVARNLNAIATKYYLPTIVGPDGKIPLQNNAVVPLSSVYERHQLQGSIKLDQTISDYHKLSGSLSATKRPRWQGATGMWNPNLPKGGPLSAELSQDLVTFMARIAYDWTLSPTKLNHIQVYFNRFRNLMPNAHEDVDGPAELGIKGWHVAGYPTFQWGGGPFISLAQPGNASHYMTATNTWGLRNTFSFSHNSHFMKGGFDGTLIFYNNVGSYNPWLNFSALSTSIPNEPFSGNVTGYSFASYLLGIVYSANNTKPLPVTDVSRYYALFFQDDYKVTKRLSLNLGVRWDYMTPKREKYDRRSGWTPLVTDPISGLPGAYAFDGNCSQCTGGRYLGRGADNKFAPRIGFAYRLFANTTLRGAYTIFYQAAGDTNEGWSTAIRTAWVGSWPLSPDPVNPWRGIFNLDDGFPTNRYVPPKLDPSWGNANTPMMFDPRYLTMPYIQHWSLNIQHAITRHLILDVGYVGVKGTSMRGDSLAVVNQIQPAYLQTFGRTLLNPVESADDAARNGIRYPFPGFRGTVASALRQYPQVVGNSTISVIGAPLGFSTTHQLQAVLDKRFSNGMTSYVNYTWSKTLTNVQSGASGGRAPLDYYNLRREKSVSIYDVPHNFKAYVAYELPIGRGKLALGDCGKFLNVFVGGWAVSAIVNYASGMPLVFSGASSPLATAWNGGGRINIAAGPMKASGFSKNNFNLAQTSSPSNTYLNKSIYSDIQPLTLGTAAYTYTQARGFGTINEDVGLQKSHRLREKYRVQIRAEFLNAFNRHTLGNIVTNINSPLFGQVTGVSGNRTVQVGARLDF